MKKYHIKTGILVSSCLILSLIGIMYLFNQWIGLPFVPFDLFDWMVQVLPGKIITFGIDLMIDVMLFLGFDVANSAKIAEQIIALLQFFVGGSIAGIVYYGVISAKNIKADHLSGIIMTALFGIPMIVISAVAGQNEVAPILRILWLTILFASWGIVLSWTYRRLFQTKTKIEKGPKKTEISVTRIDRRRFLIQLGGASATITVIGAGLGTFLSKNKKQKIDEEFYSSMAHGVETPAGKVFPNINDPVMPAPGTRPEYTPIKDHYKVFIRTKPTEIDGSKWMLPITGLVENPLMLTLKDIKTKYQAVSEYVTISCISGRVGTKLIGTTLWTGARLKDILSDAKVKPEARYLYINSGDGFYETVDLEQIEEDDRIMMCYAWDGHDLPVDHGYPLRIWIPDRYGMKQPKWITGMELSDKYKPGYWVERNWDKTAQVKTTSVIDTVAVNAMFERRNKKFIPIGGIAFSGARGISIVEVRINGGKWEKTKLRSPLSKTTWVIWYYDWPFERGEITFEVRCAEGDGTPQIEKKHSSRPSGATGLYSKKVKL